MESANSATILPEACRDPALLNDWHVVAVSEELVPGKLVPLILLERELVGWREAGGAVHHQYRVEARCAAGAFGRFRERPGVRDAVARVNLDQLDQR